MFNSSFPIYMLKWRKSINNYIRNILNLKVWKSIEKKLGQYGVEALRLSDRYNTGYDIEFINNDNFFR